jgi:deoxyinosine 3'endonuclease (endonuclease V)
MGDYVELVGKSNTIWGLALKSSEKTQNPIYVSIGHKISLETAKNLVLKTCLFKNPEPIRNSDIKSKLYF